MYGIIMFIIGGFVSAIIFYPSRKKEKRQIDLEFLAYILSYQWHSGISYAQNKKDAPYLSEDLVSMVSNSPQAKANFMASAEIVAKRIYK